MADTPQEIVERELREFKRYTGDGLPGEPVNAPLPVGDPQSGVWNPKKKNLRVALMAPIAAAAQSASEAGAARDEAVAVAPSTWQDLRDETVEARDKSQEWAENPEDDEVEPGEYSALHHAAKAQGSAVVATNEADRSSDEADRAETAKDGTLLAAASVGYFEDTTAGISGTTDGQVFWTIEDEEMVYYQRVAGSAVDVGRFPTTARFDSTVRGAAEVFSAPNLFPAEVYYLLEANDRRLSDGALSLTNGNVVATAEVIDGKRYLSVTTNNASSGGTAYQNTLANLGMVPGEKFSFSARVVDRTGAGSASVAIEQFSPSGAIAGTLVNVSAPTEDNFDGDYLLLAEGMTLHPDCTYLRINFITASNANSFKLTELLLAKGGEGHFRPSLDRRTSRAKDNAWGAGAVFSNPNLFHDVYFDTMAAATGVADEYGAVSVKNENVVLAKTTILGKPALNISTTGVSGGVSWVQTTDNLGVSVGDTISVSFEVADRAGVSSAANVEILQLDAGGGGISGTSRIAHINPAPLEGGVLRVEPVLFRDIPIHEDCRSIRLLFIADATSNYSITDVLIAKGGDQGFRPSYRSTLYSRSEVDALIGVNRKLNNFAIVGDSRQAQMYTDTSTQKVRTAWHFFNWANTFPSVNQRLQCVYNGAIGGARSDEYLTPAKVAEVLGTTAKWAMIWGVVNDIAQGYTAQQAWEGYGSGYGIKDACDTFVAAGMNVILVTEIGASNFASSNERGEVNKYNQIIRSYSESTPGVLLFDVAEAMMDPISSPPDFIEGGSDDGVHPRQLPSFYAGIKFAEMMIPLVPPMPRNHTSVLENYANGGTQVLDNALFLTSSGGNNYTSGAITGDVPADWDLYVAGSAGVSGTITTEALADGSNEVVLALSGTNRDQMVTFQHNAADLVSRIANGEKMRGGAEIQVEEGAINFAGATVLCEINADGNTQFSNTQSLRPDGYVTVAPSGERTEVHMTEEMIVAGLTSIDFASFKVRIFPATTGASAAEAWSCTVRIRKPWYRKLL